MALIMEPARELAQQTSDNITRFKRHLPSPGVRCVCVCVRACIDGTRKWIGNAVQNVSSSSVRSRGEIARVRRVPLPSGPGFELQSSARSCPSL